MLVLEKSLRLSTIVIGFLAVTMLVEVTSLLLCDDDEWDVEVVLSSKSRPICIIDVAVIMPAPRGWDSVEA
jgi:hypothetical protein